MVKKRAEKHAESLNVDTAARKILRGVDFTQSAETWGRALLENLAHELEIMTGIIYFRNREGVYEPAATYAFHMAHTPYTFREGEGLSGQAAMNREVHLLKSIPAEYGTVFSGLGDTAPDYLAMVPVGIAKQTVVLLECAGFRFASEPLDQLFQILAREMGTRLSELQEKGGKDA
mgnify:CR=1 FL=1